jgi:hypothetical protein
MNNLYYKLNEKCKIRKELLEYAISNVNWDPKENLTFLQTSIPKELIEKDLLLLNLANTLGRHYDIGVRIFKMPSWVYYNLHTDAYRPCAINMLLNDISDSVSFFETASFRIGQIAIQELKYETDCLYLFNTQIKHAVLNKNEDRYVLSIAMNGIGDFEKSLNFLKQNNL